MPAPKDPEFTKSSLLQVRVIPGIKKEVDEYINRIKEEYKLDYGYPQFLREAIMLKLSVPIGFEKTITDKSAGKVWDMLEKFSEKTSTNEQHQTFIQDMTTRMVDLQEWLEKFEDRLSKLEKK